MVRLYDCCPLNGAPVPVELSVALTVKLNVPAAVGVRGALRSVRDGQWIALDGVSGRVHLAPDDTPETVAARLRVYRDKTEPLAERYRTLGLFHRIDGDRPVDEVASDVLATLNRVTGRVLA